jgi:hypothetical protein
MPYSIEAAPGGGYRVKNTQTGAYHSKKGIPKVRAERQMKLLYGIEQGMIPRQKKKDRK